MKCAVLFLFALAAPLCGSEPAQPPYFREVAFYEVRPLQESPGRDDRLTPLQWEAIPAAERFFVYWKAEPDLSPLRGRFQMAYDDRAIYLRVTAQEPAMDRLRAAVPKRGNPSLWTDDCFELYFDPQARGVSYLVFTVNSLGVQNDRKQLDAAVSLAEWRGENWRTWATRGEDQWIVEITFPFADLEATPRAGDLWTFNAVRYSYTSGEFQGASWSPGGNYASPGNFGYLFFGQATPATPEAIAERLEPKVKAPWSVEYQGVFIRSRGEGEPQVLPTKTAAQQTLAAYRHLLDQAALLAKESAHTGEQVETLRAQATALRVPTAEEAASAIRALRPLSREAYALYWALRLRALFDATPSQ